jgi:hypothetical protein
MHAHHVILELVFALELSTARFAHELAMRRVAQHVKFELVRTGKLLQKDKEEEKLKIKIKINKFGYLPTKSNRTNLEP